MSAPELTKAQLSFAARLFALSAVGNMDGGETDAEAAVIALAQKRATRALARYGLAPGDVHSTELCIQQAKEARR